MKFKKGAYYKLMFENHIWLFKLHIIKKRHIESTNFFINNGIFMNHKAIMRITRDDIFEEILIEDIIKYLPKNHEEVFEYRKHRIKLILNKYES